MPEEHKNFFFETITKLYQKAEQSLPDKTNTEKRKEVKSYKLYGRLLYLHKYVSLQGIILYLPLFLSVSCNLCQVIIMIILDPFISGQLASNILRKHFYNHCVKTFPIRSFSCPYFPAFGLNTEIDIVNLRISQKMGKYGPEKLRRWTLFTQ